MDEHLVGENENDDDYNYVHSRLILSNDEEILSKSYPIQHFVYDDSVKISIHDTNIDNYVDYKNIRIMNSQVLELMKVSFPYVSKENDLSELFDKTVKDEGKLKLFLVTRSKAIYGDYFDELFLSESEEIIAKILDFKPFESKDHVSISYNIELFDINKCKKVSKESIEMEKKLFHIEQMQKEMDKKCEHMEIEKIIKEITFKKS